MGDVHPSKSALGQLSHRLLAVFSLEWVAALIEVTHSLYHLLAHGHNQGMYEILSYDSTLELVDPKGTTAVFKRHQKVRFLQDHTFAFQDHAWGEGNLFADYQVSPGKVADRWQDGDRWNILISLRETKSKEDIEDIYIERTVNDGFTKESEWRQTEVWHAIRFLHLAVLFPKERHCKRAVVHTRIRNKTTVLGPEHFQQGV